MTDSKEKNWLDTLPLKSEHKKKLIHMCIYMWVLYLRAKESKSKTPNLHRRSPKRPFMDIANIAKKRRLSSAAGYKQNLSTTRPLWEFLLNDGESETLASTLKLNGQAFNDAIPEDSAFGILPYRYAAETLDINLDRVAAQMKSTKFVNTLAAPQAPAPQP